MSEPQSFQVPTASDVPPDVHNRPELPNLALAEYQFLRLRLRLMEDFPKDPKERTNGELLLASLKLAQQSCDLARYALQRESHLHEMILCRPLLDIAVRLVYAVRCPDGWQRYHRYWAEEELKWAKGATRTFPTSFGGWVAAAEKDRDEIPAGPMPSDLPTILKEILEVERTQGGPVEDFNAVYQMLFKLPHSVIHGNPEYLLGNLHSDRADNEWRNGRCILFGQVAYLLTRAVYIFRRWPNPNEDAARHVRSYYRLDSP